jgi:ATP-dependent helicase/DNAse subunit B
MRFIDVSPSSVFKRQVVSSVVTNLSIEPLITNIRLLFAIFNLAVEDVNKKVEGVVRALAAEVLTKFEKKKKIDNVQELIILATYLNMKKLDDVREQIEGVMRGFQRLDALLDVVKELRAALERLEKSRPDEAAALLREVNTKLDQVLEKLGAFSIEET